MALIHLNDFQKFDFVEFFKGKTCEVTQIRSWDEYKDGEKTGDQLGFRFDAVINEDNTVYNLKDGEVANNKYRIIAFKIEKKMVRLEAGSPVFPVHVGDKIGYGKGCFSPQVVKCTPYGNNGFLNNLSIVVSGFEFVK